MGVSPPFQPLETPMSQSQEQSRLQYMAFFCSFFYSRMYQQILQLSSMTSQLFKKKFQSRRKVHFLGVGLLLSLHSFNKITFIGNNTLQVNPATHTVIAKRDIFPIPGNNKLESNKQAKRIPDTTVETTPMKNGSGSLKNFNLMCLFSNFHCKKPKK